MGSIPFDVTITLTAKELKAARKSVPQTLVRAHVLVAGGKPVEQDWTDDHKNWATKLVARIGDGPIYADWPQNQKERLC